MGSHCITCNGDGRINHTTKDVKAGDLISTACGQNYGLIQLKNVMVKERYFSTGKDPKMILNSFLIREELANDNQI